jgi:hypothetical protein
MYSENSFKNWSGENCGIRKSFRLMHAIRQIAFSPKPVL